MRIQNLKIENFKRFSHLELTEIPDTAKLVLLIGSNGSGKSSLFDGFQWIKSVNNHSAVYHAKDKQKKTSIEIGLSNGEKMQMFSEPGGVTSLDGTDLTPKFYGRSSNRIVPRIPASGIPSEVEKDGDAPNFYIDSDNRFVNDVFKYIGDINQALREPVFQGRSADTVEIFRKFIDPVNKALSNILGVDNRIAIQLASFEDAPSPSQPARLLFRKGEATINYDLLSHGEKQVITLLLNFIVRNRYHQDSIYFIDEMDVHLNTAVQYSMLQEIVTNWIPENCQLWTASHSLGFIEFARNSPDAVIFDFDELDFDQQQTLQPLSKDSPDIYEIAVRKEFIPALIKQGFKFYLVENKDKVYYAQINLPSCLFIEENNKNSVFSKIKTGNFFGIIDRDFLTEEDIALVHKYYPKLFVLGYYSIENLLYHPDNLEEFFQSQNKAFDKVGYKEQILQEKNKVMDKIRPNLSMRRTSYPFFKETGFPDRTLQYRFSNKHENEQQSEILSQALQSNDFEVFYRILPMKEYCTQIPGRQNLRKEQLAKTNWFKNEVKKTLGI